ncbi:hypothetical protein AN639_00355 [Candidatus Epulonipiscium fishelsonii]|uniref:Uncharacterized protein n=1 Tax=Candidatus Epulonipiscium fishelsonii TaxID=77094 RepID=A0ACC8XD09_9FIRM|nr:hypothetical protein AN396_05425 [Epulopiscium sp. SCG-B11WGA-EpuloA1]ONI41837.1 hypothetical protein AN639_00355 [Epulopiscium sp. SCG-B05WGA-EpuloA1]
MSKETFTIKEASDYLDVEPYLIRYYEKELALNILRNAQGHRVFSLDNIEVINYITELRDQGIELKAIKNALKGKDCCNMKNLVEVAGAILSVPQKPAHGTEQESDFGTDRELSSVEQTSVKDVSPETQDKLKNFISTAIKESMNESKEEITNKIKQEISEEVLDLVDKKVSVLQSVVEEKNEKFDNMAREVQRMKRDIANLELQHVSIKPSIFERLFGKKDTSTKVSDTQKVPL